ncbi:MAG: restriction endonuclease subunit S [Gammaproteobacteria bacterium]
MWASPSDLKQYGIKIGDMLVCEGGEGGRCGIVKEDISGYIIQNALHRVRPLNENSNHFLQYVMSHISMMNWFEAINNKATIAHFTVEKFKMLRIPLPSPKEQTAIIKFLDWKEARIQRHLRTKQKLIALLEELKTATIQQAVTRGLNPHVPLKSSGVQWLGDVPKHWVVERLKTRLIHNDSGVWGEFDEDNGTIVLRSTEQTINGGWSISNPAKINLSESQRKAVLLKVGDLVITKSSGSKSHIGKTGLVGPKEARLNCGFSNFMQRIRLDSKTNPGFIWRGINSLVGREQLVFQSTTTTGLGNLTGRILRNCWFVFPPLSEQTAIVEHLDKATAQIDAVIAKVRREMELLREYRVRLISDVVTGKIDVRKAAAKLPAVENSDY